MAAILQRTMPSHREETKPASSSSKMTDLVRFLSTLRGDLANITAPPSFLAPSSVLENPRCWAQRPDVFAAPALEEDPLKRSLLVLRMYLIGLRSQFYVGGRPGVNIKKPLNAFLGEVLLASFTDDKSGSRTEMVCEQVSHHPPITAVHIASPEHGVRADGYARVEMTFSGSLNVRHMGHTSLRIERFDEEYLMPFPQVQVRGFMSACLYPEVWGTYKILSDSGYVSEMTFSGAGFLYGKKRNSFEAKVYHKDRPKDVKYKVSGVWSEGWVVTDVSTGKVIEKYKVDDEANRPAEMEVAPLEEQDAWESRRAWGSVIEGIRSGDWSATSRAKHAVEEAQRQMRRAEKQDGQTWEPLLFESSSSGGHSYDTFQRLAGNEPGWDLEAAETRGVWRAKQEGLPKIQRPFRGELTPMG